MSELLKKVYKEQDEKDHEVSMARGELEAIADKATQLASMLQGKSDEGNPLEAWVQSKITKAKDYINSVSDYLMYNPDMANEEVELDERTRYAKETGKDYTTGKPSVKGGEEPPSAMKHLQKKFRSSGGMMSSRKKPIPIPGKKKEKGAKPKFKTAPTPVDKIKAKLAKKRAPKKDPYGYGQGRYQGD